MVFVDAANTWCGYRMREGAIPAVQLEVLFYLTVLCFAILVPYLYYVFRFLHPSTLLRRHEREARAGCVSARRRRPKSACGEDLEMQSIRLGATGTRITVADGCRAFPVSRGTLAAPGRSSMRTAKTRLGGEAVRYLAEYLSKIDETVALLAPEHVWWRANERSNSVGNLLLHLTGNLSQWVLAGLGGEVYERRRAAEFAAREGANTEALLDGLRAVVKRCIGVAARLDEDALAARHAIQGYRRDGFGVLLHAVEHMAHHTSQIVLLAKQLAGARVEIGFYPQIKER